MTPGYFISIRSYHTSGLNCITFDPTILVAFLIFKYVDTFLSQGLSTCYSFCLKSLPLIYTHGLLSHFIHMIFLDHSFCHSLSPYHVFIFFKNVTWPETLPFIVNLFPTERKFRLSKEFSVLSNCVLPVPSTMPGIE